MSRSEREGDGASRRLRGLVFLVVCLGVARFLVTGDSIRAGLTTVLLLGFFTLAHLLAPHRVYTNLPVWALYVAGVALLLAPPLGFRLGYESPWDELEPRFPTAAPLPAGLPCYGNVALVRRVDLIQVRRYPLRRVTCTFTDAGAGFAHSWPLSLVYGPIGISRRDLASCSERAMEFGYTRLEIAGLRIALEVDDVDRRVLEWCRERGLAPTPPAAARGPVGLQPAAAAPRPAMPG